jgi:exonuclease V gamma subunit
MHNNDFKLETKTIGFVSFQGEGNSTRHPCIILNKITNYMNTWETNITTDEIEPCIEEVQRICVISSQEHYLANF